jgi:hypothetical protein
VLTPEALELYPDVEERCRVGLSKPDSWGKLAGNNLLKTEENESRTALYKQFEAMHPNLVIKAPIRISQSIPDKRVNAALTAILVEQLKATNGDANVLYKPYLLVSLTHDPVELGFHFGLIDTDSDAVTGWLATLLPEVK